MQVRVAEAAVDLNRQRIAARLVGLEREKQRLAQARWGDLEVEALRADLASSGAAAAPSSSTTRSIRMIGLASHPASSPSSSQLVHVPGGG